MPQELCTFQPLPSDLIERIRGRGDFAEILEYLSAECPEVALALAGPTATIPARLLVVDNDGFRGPRGTTPVNGGGNGGDDDTTVPPDGDDDTTVPPDGDDDTTPPPDGDDDTTVPPDTDEDDTTAPPDTDEDDTTAPPDTDEDDTTGECTGTCEPPQQGGPGNPGNTKDVGNSRYDGERGVIPKNKVVGGKSR